MSKILQFIKKLKSKLAPKAKKTDVQIITKPLSKIEYGEPTKAKRTKREILCPNCKKKMILKTENIISYNLKSMLHEYFICENCGFERVI